MRILGLIGLVMVLAVGAAQAQMPNIDIGVIANIRAGHSRVVSACKLAFANNPDRLLRRMSFSFCPCVADTFVALVKADRTLSTDVERLKSTARPYVDVCAVNAYNAVQSGQAAANQPSAVGPDGRTYTRDALFQQCWAQKAQTMGAAGQGYCICAADSYLQVAQADPTLAKDPKKFGETVQARVKENCPS